MLGKVVLWSLAFLTLVSFHSGAPGGPGTSGGIQDRIVALYHASDSLYHLSHSTPTTDSMAFAGFTQVIDKLLSSPSLPASSFAPAPTCM